MDTPTTTISLAELAAPTSCGASLATRSHSEVFAAEAEGRAPLAPSPEDIATLTTQYRKAVNGLYEAYLFGQMLLAVQKRLSLSLTRETKGEWHAPAGSGIKGWLAQHCPEINYKTALRFLAVAEKTHAALAAGDPAAPGAWGEAPCASAGVEGAAQAPSEATVRAFLEGKSQRAVLRAGGARAGAGRPRKDWAAALGTSPEAAMKRLEEALAPLNELIVVKGTHRLLAAADLETLRAAIDLLHERVHAEI